MLKQDGYSFYENTCSNIQSFKVYLDHFKSIGILKLLA